MSGYDFDPMGRRTWRAVRNAKDPAAYVASFGPGYTWGGKHLTVTLVEVLPGETKSGRKRFIIQFVEDA